jgi:hypothetical protein
MQKSLRDRRVRRVHIEASCVSITAEYLFDFFLRRQITTGSARFDDLPLFIAHVIVCAPFDLVDESHEIVLVVWRPMQHTIEHCFELIFRHARIIPRRSFARTPSETCNERPTLSKNQPPKLGSTAHFPTARTLQIRRPIISVAALQIRRPAERQFFANPTPDDPATRVNRFAHPAALYGRFRYSNLAAYLLTGLG